MQLDYLLFDGTDDASEACSFDAMASVLPDRLPALAHEIEAVLGWACRAFGAPATEADAGGWDFALHAVGDPDVPLEIAFDVDSGRLALPSGHPGRVTVSLTLGGDRAFGEAFRDAFPESA